MLELAQHLRQYDAAAWRKAIDLIAPAIHEVDRAATRIWFAFFPLELCEAFEKVEGDEAAAAALARRLRLMGEWRLSALVDESHRFLYAHRYWPQVKAAIGALESLASSLPALITSAADAAARTARVDRERLLGLSAVGLMTLRQAGLEAFQRSKGTVHLSEAARVRSTYQVLHQRRRVTSQGLFGFLRGQRSRWTIRWDESDPTAAFEAIHGQDLASAAQGDRRDHRSRDARCIVNEGPIPVECRAASCGTCWVGVLEGAGNLSPIDEREEGRHLRRFGYVGAGDRQPLIRLACQARAEGDATIVLSPWNGFVASLVSTDAV
jgi:ferredoxin